MTADPGATATRRARPQDWWRVTRLSDGVTRIDEPHVREFYRCNCWHVRGDGANPGDGDLLIDSGMGVVSLRDWVPLVTERPLLAVASHTHVDHVGCHHEFDRRAAHRAEAEILAAPTRANTVAEGCVADGMFHDLPPEPFSAAAYEVAAAPATQLLEDGDVLAAGRRRFEVLHTPGHSPGGISLWEAETGILFTGDVVYDGPLVEDLFHSDADDYVRSMERLLRIPARMVHGGHFPSFDGERLRRIIGDWLREHGA